MIRPFCLARVNQFSVIFTIFIFITGPGLPSVDIVLAETRDPNGKKEITDLDLLYQSSQLKFHSKNYKEALPLLFEYIQKNIEQNNKRERLLWVMDQIGMIYLRVLKRPEDAVAFFNRMGKDKRLNEAEENTVQEWLGAAQDWAKRNPDIEKLDRESLFLNGKKYFQDGLKLSKKPDNENGNGYFHISANYLIPFIRNHDSDPRIGEALLMLGTVKSFTHHDMDFWSENFYLKEVIRRFPHSVEAKKSFERLEQEIHFGYSGSGGDHTPPSVLTMLERYRELATPEK